MSHPKSMNLGMDIQVHTRGIEEISSGILELFKNNVEFQIMWNFHGSRF